MTFTTRAYLKYLVPIPMVLGFAMLGYIYFTLDYESDTDQSVAVGMTILILIFFIGLPYLTLRYVKVIEVNKGVWIIRHPYLKRSIEVNRENILRVLIIENISWRYLPLHHQINITVKDGSSVSINSMETENFNQLVDLINQDFREFVKCSTLWTEIKGG